MMTCNASETGANAWNFNKLISIHQTYQGREKTQFPQIFTHADCLSKLNERNGNDVF